MIMIFKGVKPYLEEFLEHIICEKICWSVIVQTDSQL